MRWIPLAVFGRMNEGIRKGAFLFGQNVQDVWSIRFTCLLVCRSAIFIGSKKG